MHKGSWKSSSSPRIAGVQWSSTVGSTLWEWRRAWQSSLVLWGLRRRPGGSSGRCGHYCGRYRPPGVAWRHSEGPAGQGLILVKAGAAFEGRVHAVRGLRGRKSTKEVWGVGSIVAGAVPSMSCTVSQVATVSSQRPEWRRSDRSWRTGLRSQSLRGMAAWRRQTRALWRSGWH